ncbi:MAG: NADH-quinone oxidoreductase subunit C [Thaumarchaeota archaeon]|nr:NADH-quinone oxidoreductase subunit C [Nitrososphaerota archaeon]
MQAQAPAAPAEPTKTKALADKFTAKFSGTVIDYVRQKRLKLTTSPDRIKEVALFSRDQLGFDHISCVSGTDWIAKNEIEVIYFVDNLSTPGFADVVLAIAERPNRDNPMVPTLIDVWPGAEYEERETHEMLGVDFQGHPNQKNLLLPEDWNDIPPLRKDYISPGR